MNQTEIWEKMIASIQQMAAEKETKNFVPSSQSDFWKQLIDSIRENKDEILIKSDAFGKSSFHLLVEGIRKKLEEENKKKRELFEAALNKTTNLICKLFQEIDAYVIANEIDANMDAINKILDELGPEFNKRKELIDLIKDLRPK